MACDLHIHTTASDGRLTLAEIVQEAKRLGLSNIAITDHDTVDGIKTLQKSARHDAELNIISGIEFSASMPKHEVHILGLGIEADNQPMNECLERVRQSRWQRLDTMLANLAAGGYERVTRELVLRVAGDSRSVGRAHIAAALVDEGYFTTVAEAFSKLLHKGGSIYVPHYRLSVTEIITLIHGAGGMAVLAHPGLVGDDNIVRQVIEAGIDGLEVYHPRHSADEMEKYKKLADEYSLLISGGSDFHAIPTRFPEKLGIFTVDDASVQSLLDVL